tara:strand:- start:136 stop:330 length:195 start_codon:yes stop_codon:yes gene_type:complete
MQQSLPANGPTGGSYPAAVLRGILSLSDYTGVTPVFQAALTQEMAEIMVHPTEFESVTSAFGGQ